MITVSKAIGRIKNTMAIAAILMVIIWIISFFWLLSGVYFVWPLLIVIVSFIGFKIFQSWYTLRWKIWAFGNVDSIPELFARSLESRIINRGVFPGKWAIGSRKDKDKLHEVLFKWINYEREEQFADKNSVPPMMTIFGSKSQNFIAFIICGAIAWMPLKRIITETSNHPETDYVFIGFLLIIGIHFLLKTFEPNTKITLSNHGIWTKKMGFQKWQMIEEIYTRNESENGQSAKDFLVINFRSSNNSENKTQKFEIKNLSKTADEIEKSLKVYQERFQQITPQQPVNTDLQQELKPNKKAFYTSFIIPIIIALLGLFFFFRSSRKMEEFDSVTGKITYIDDSFGKYKNSNTKFIQIDQNPTIFTFFIGKGKWDFKPESERVNELKLNDTVTIYSDDRWTSVTARPEERLLDKHTRFITKKGQIFYSKGDSGKLPAYLLFIVSGLAFLVLLFKTIRRS